jgi:hypothetical protein
MNMEPQRVSIGGPDGGNASGLPRRGI